ncbi:hypothetical protein A2631_02050 [Candidatus Daviesbacteria bacterium RIFCSPHIGHO2_01_FULL_44_29]|uniref:PEP-utilising enzyme C-terminal domain-containing protein n=1 Tax=Candidatus Daviesbacteria bacterium RIFCSPHIGHO2_02_FULL_43_12 TaxID=1797776 RepID=A0A1F5KK25_9BACT|nr:MAG: hypothetical protein A2631_02050 [Candidatus Daviesbacteria bacterium RIFCSPHIGHO2_01_FULL_44_29]OGE39545.1 MAG: hypothetical protein A3E86_01850 [Candidatus Daviesbacteria bacterium RIFCSPHIGHO2_12_FULL_47_45]OGE41179.1 MAG: hypothetical protein A3D25_01445 [Candidatus Daviesbacteria bacterium RIFCSPHIGHO2_02_FULL_43_12]OGE69378.1 MAG: hypothetical protein A3B55_03185 [Candidatus Daviesbacteria bacterium RIFCSPLOWO2_01_FULL_43_15]
MNYLPIKSITDQDAPVVGGELVRLARLQRAGLPVADGIAVFPPHIKLQTILEHFDLRDHEIFEQRLTLVKQEISQIPLPEDLKAELLKRRIDPQATWTNLLDVWLSDIRSRIWREGFSKGITNHLLAHPVFFTAKILHSGKAYYNAGLSDTQIVIHKGSLTSKFLEKIDGIVQAGNKMLLLPQTFFWIIDGLSIDHLKLVKLLPYGGELSVSEQEEKQAVSTRQEAKKVFRQSALQVFLQMTSSFDFVEGVQGAVVSASVSSDTAESEGPDFDRQALQLIECAQTFYQSPVIFRLSDVVDKVGGIRGSLRLLHQNNLLRTEVSAYLFARNKKQLLNIDIAIPFTRGVSEFTQLKRELSSLGVSRKSTLKLWLELAVPENLLNLEKYLEVGFDGALLHLDELFAWIGGFDPNEPESAFYKPSFAGKQQLDALLSFLDGPIRLLHQEKIPILCIGSYSLNDDVLEFLIERGVWGVVVSKEAAPFVHEHIGFLERRLVRKKTS